MAFYELGQRFETGEEWKKFIQEGFSKYGKDFNVMIDNYRKHETRVYNEGADYEFKEKYGAEYSKLFEEAEENKRKGENDKYGNYFENEKYRNYFK